MLLKNNISPAYIKQLTIEQRKQLCKEIRHLLVKTVTNTGGHLASNLGTVELIVAMHSVFDTPEDKFVFDVGHQSYTHKIITGRAGKLNTLRQKDGISGFPRNEESIHDCFIGGHSSISISAALGMAKAMQLDGNKNSVVAVIGDGALTGGEAYEGINNSGKTDANLIVVLNDNEMSISKNTGALALYLAQIRSSQKYYRTKTSVKNLLQKTPVVGSGINSAMRTTKQILKFMLYRSNLFENLGFKYLGPIDGHNLEELTEALSVAKMMQRPCLVHVYTVKGKGYAPAENNSGEYHGISPKEAPKETGCTFTEAFSEVVCKVADNDKNICAITAAMKYGTGLQCFAKKHPSRFFDVGIAEQHAVTFAAGLASCGKLPVFAVYSSFLQRSFDQLIHDCSIEKKHIVLAVDRSGFVGEDGETHHGLFDIPMLTAVPGVVIYSPSDTKELEFCFNNAVNNDRAVSVVRYPKGASLYDSEAECYYDYKYINNNNKKLIVTFGRISAFAVRNSDIADVLVLVKIFPVEKEIIEIITKYDEVYFFEESSYYGGISEKICAMLSTVNYIGKITVRAVNKISAQAPYISQLAESGLDYNSMRKTIGD